MNMGETLLRKDWKDIFMLLLFLSLATGCSLCERGGDSPGASGAAVTSLAVMVPGDVDAAFFVDDLKAIRSSIGVLERRFSKQLPIEPYLAEIKRSLSLDLRDIPDLNRTKGIRTSAGMAVSFHKKQLVVFVPLENKLLFEQYIKVLGKDRLKAAEPVTKEVDGEKIVFLQKMAPGAQKAPAAVTPENLLLAYCIKGETAILFPGKTVGGNTGDAEIVLTRHLKLQAEKSLAKVPDFEKLKKIMAAGHPIVGYVNTPATIDGYAEELGEFTYNKEMAADYRKMAAESGWTGVGLKVDDTGVQLRAQVLAGGALKSRIDGAARAVGSAEAVATSLGGEPALLLKLSVDPQKGYQELRKVLGTNVDMVDEILELLKRQFSVDVASQLIPTLDGNIAWAVYETPPSLLRKPELVSLMRSGRTTFTLGLKDRAAFIKIFDGVVDGAGGFVKKGDEGGVPVYTFEDTKPVARLAVGEKMAVLAGAKISSIEAVSLASGKGGPSDGALKNQEVQGLLSSQTMTGLMLDPNQLTKIVGQTRAASPFEGLDMLLLTLRPNEHGGVIDLKLAFKPETDPQP